MTAMPLEQKVRQLDNDVQALYDLVHKISTTQVRHSNRFDEITADLAGHTDRLERLEGKVDSIETKLDSVEGKVDSIETKLDEVLERLQP